MESIACCLASVGFGLQVSSVCIDSEADALEALDPDRPPMAPIDSLQREDCPPLELEAAWVRESHSGPVRCSSRSGGARRGFLGRCSIEYTRSNLQHRGDAALQDHPETVFAFKPAFGQKTIRLSQTAEAGWFETRGNCRIERSCSERFGRWPVLSRQRHVLRFFRTTLVLCSCPSPPQSSFSVSCSCPRCWAHLLRSHWIIQETARCKLLLLRESEDASCLLDGRFETTLRSMHRDYMWDFEGVPPAAVDVVQNGSCEIR